MRFKLDFWIYYIMKYQYLIIIFYIFAEINSIFLNNDLKSEYILNVKRYKNVKKCEKEIDLL